jgi:hypothetical protein
MDKIKAEKYVKKQQPVEKVLFLSLRAKRGNLAFNKGDWLEIASSSRMLSGLLAMTCDGFFNSLTRSAPFLYLKGDKNET